jgi:hypothetical protein
MGAKKYPVLLRHRLSHLKALRIDPALFHKGFQADCVVGKCDGTCCKSGVYADVEEQKTILKHATLIKKHMDPGQETDVTRWFERRKISDDDFPSGQCIGTESSKRGCVFLNAKGHCVLQKTSLSEGLGAHALKPFYCFAYPITIDRGVLTIHESEFAQRPQCCGIAGKGTKTAIEVCAEELEFMLGKDGFAGLLELQEELL